MPILTSKSCYEHWKKNTDQPQMYKANWPGLEFLMWSLSPHISGVLVCWQNAIFGKPVKRKRDNFYTPCCCWSHDDSIPSVTVKCYLWLQKKVWTYTCKGTRSCAEGAGKLPHTHRSWQSQMIMEWGERWHPPYQIHRERYKRERLILLQNATLDS